MELNPWWNSARSGITPTLPVAQHRKLRQFPFGAPKTFMQSRRGHGNTIRWDANCVFAGVFCCLGWVFFLLFLCFNSSWTKFFIICSCRSRAGFVEPQRRRRSKSLRDARMHPKGATHRATSTWTGSNPSGCSFIH